MNLGQVGEESLQSVAEQWATTQSEIEASQERERLARADVQRLRERSKTLAEQLLKRVGANITTRVFDVAASVVVIVEHERGVRLVATEPKAK